MPVDYNAKVKDSDTMFVHGHHDVHWASCPDAKHFRKRNKEAASRKTAAAQDNPALSDAAQAKTEQPVSIPNPAKPQIA